jgi:hypothetical protein
LKRKDINSKDVHAVHPEKEKDKDASWENEQYMSKPKQSIS